MSEQQALRPVASAPRLEVEAAVKLGRHRAHRFPARGHVVKVLYSVEERDIVERAAEVAGLRPSSYVAAAALRMAQGVLQPREGAGQDGATEAQLVVVAWSDREDRELLAELIQARLALRRYGVNVNQAAAVLNSGGTAPVWLEQAIAGGDRAVARVDAAAAALARRLT
jgi:uncharacterized protein (DUF1778 family)